MAVGTDVGTGVGTCVGASVGTGVGETVGVAVGEANSGRAPGDRLLSSKKPITIASTPASTRQIFVPVSRPRRFLLFFPLRVWET